MNCKGFGNQNLRILHVKISLSYRMKRSFGYKILQQGIESFLTNLQEVLHNGIVERYQEYVDNEKSPRRAQVKELNTSKL